MNHLLQIFANKSFVDEIVFGVLGVIVFHLGMIAFSRLSDALFAEKNFTVSGTWLARFESYISGKRNIEIVRFVQKRERISFKIQQFSTPQGRVKKFKGEGILRGVSLSAVYYAADPQDIQSGVLALSAGSRSGDGGTSLRGHYAELPIGADFNRIVIGKEEYILNRFHLSIFQRLKLFFGIHCFKDYADACQRTQQSANK
jgi:hypothetical protein